MQHLTEDKAKVHAQAKVMLGVLLQVQHAHREDVLRAQLLDQLDDVPDRTLVRLEAREDREQLWQVAVEPRALEEQHEGARWVVVRRGRARHLRAIGVVAWLWRLQS